MKNLSLNPINKIRILKPIAMAVATFVVTACSSSGGGSPSASLGTGPLAGVWERCQNGLQTIYTFTDTRWKENKELYQSQDCTGSAFPDSGIGELVFEGVYSLEGPSTSEGGLAVQLFNMTSDTLNGVAVFESAQVTQYNIVYTGTAGQLVFGEFNRRGESARPTQLDFEAPFVRK